MRTEWIDQIHAPEASHTRLVTATGEQIDSYDLVHQAVACLPDPADRLLVWAVAASAAFRQRGPAWSRIGRIISVDRRTIKAAYRVAVIEAAWRWNHAASTRKPRAGGRR